MALNVVPAERHGGSVEAYRPTTKAENRHREMHLEHLAILSDWPEMEIAADQMLDAQAAHVAWWDANVGVRESPGRNGVKSSADRGTISMRDAESQSGISNQQVSRWRKRLADRQAYRAALIEHAKKKALQVGKTTHQNAFTGNNEWFTPSKYIDMAREVMGGIDLDPASNDLAQDTVRADEFFTKQDDGLSRHWHGRVWLNPPYANPLLSAFVDKLSQSWADGDLIAAILLTHNSTETAWFRRAAHACSSICFPSQRIRFVSPSGDLASPTQGQAFFYFGDDYLSFESVFGGVGLICVPKSSMGD